MNESEKKYQWLMVELKNGDEARVRLPLKPTVSQVKNILESVEKIPQIPVLN